MTFDIATVTDIIREALFVVLKVGLPVLLGSMVIGLVIAVFQAATQIHEQTLTFVPKLIVIILVLIILGPWMAKEITELFEYLFNLMTNFS
ncbi:MAG: flagellar biosynthesis protein FliQ [Oscillospiraceae bacterium]|nr:flagellar biosynthesis protein FliQ [Oscillospiraceae bacterium]